MGRAFRILQQVWNDLRIWAVMFIVIFACIGIAVVTFFASSMSLTDAEWITFGHKMASTFTVFPQPVWTIINGLMVVALIVFVSDAIFQMILWFRPSKRKIDATQIEKAFDIMLAKLRGNPS